MTSRQPGTTQEAAGTPMPGDRPVRGPGWLAPVLPLTLLIILGLAGLRGAVTEPRWNGPWQRDGLVIGVALELVLGVLLVITMRRRARAELASGAVNSVAVKLRGVLIFLLSTGMAAVAVATIIGLHLHEFSLKPRRPSPPVSPAATGKLRTPPPQSRSSSTVHIPGAVLLYALLVVVLVAAVVLSIWWSRRFRPPGQVSGDGFIVEDSQDLREAVESGRSALRTFDDARAAIIACYLAMETHLAERGTARAIADTPDELLARARATGLVRGTAAARLTALFYEARFSSHPLDRSHRDAAAQALDELAEALAQAVPASGAGAGETGAGA
jgi:hypothetical protein